MALADLIVARLLPADSALTIAVDDTLFKRSGKKVFGAAINSASSRAWAIFPVCRGRHSRAGHRQAHRAGQKR